MPLYEQYVVTVSADSPEGLCGYTDLALGSFPPGADIEKCVGVIVTGDWETQLLEWNQRQWEYVLEPGLINSETLRKWPGEVWAQEGEDKELD